MWARSHRCTLRQRNEGFRLLVRDEKVLVGGSSVGFRSTFFTCSVSTIMAWGVLTIMDCIVLSDYVLKTPCTWGMWYRRLIFRLDLH